MRRISRLVLSSIGAAGLTVALGGPALAAASAGAKALESRLYAPCCYGGTLDIHDSELAKSLRDEVETRIERGESSDAIQEDFVARYGEKVLAARSESPIRNMAYAVGVATLLAAAGLFALVRRWTGRARDEEQANAGARDALDERIDSELAELDS